MTTRYSFKVIIIGDYAVGKTSILRAHISKEFSMEYKPTLGANILKTVIEVPEKNTQVIFNFNDIAGQNLFKNMHAFFFQGSDAVLLLYDCTRRETFDNIDFWYKSVLEYTDSYRVGLLICNKVDLEGKRVISEKEGREKANQLDSSRFKYMETSAKTSHNIEMAFNYIADKLII